MSEPPRPRCPVPGCSNPYLAWHEVRPDERVALCLTHVEEATAAAVPPDHLLALARANGRPGRAAPTSPVWRRRKVLARIGGNFAYETPVILRLGTVTTIAFGRDQDENLLLSVRMPTTSGHPRATLVDSFWEVLPSGAGVVCPASGRVLDIAYPDGDRFRVEFTEVHNAGALQLRFGTVARWAYRVEFPVTLAELSLTVANTDLAFGPDTTSMGDPATPTTDCFTSHGDAAIDVRMTSDQVAGLFPGGAS